MANAERPDRRRLPLEVLAIGTASVVAAAVGGIWWWPRRRMPRCSTCGGTQCAC